MSFPSHLIRQQVYVLRNEQIAAYLKTFTSPYSSERSESIQFLAFNRDSIKNLGSLIWETPAGMITLLGEIMSIYPAMTSVSTNPTSFPSPMSQKHAIHVCNCMGLMQCVAASPDVRGGFVRSCFHSYLFPFIHSTNQSRESEMLKIAALGVIASLAASESTDVIRCLFQSEFVPLCLRVLKFGQEMSRIVAAYVFAKIVADPEGIASITSTNDKLMTALHVLNKVIIDLFNKFSPKLSRNIIVAYRAILDVAEASSTAKRIASQELSSLRLLPDMDQDLLDLYNALRTDGNQ